MGYIQNLIKKEIFGLEGLDAWNSTTFKFGLYFHPDDGFNIINRNFGKILTEYTRCQIPESVNLHGSLSIHLKQKEPLRHMFKAMHFMQL